MSLSQASRRARWVLFAVIVAGAVVSRARAQAPFTEEALQRGIAHVTVAATAWGYGMAVNDLDGDGDPDVVFTGRYDGVLGIYENDGTGHFIDHSGQPGVPVSTAFCGVAAGDYDGDGDLDLYISAFNAPNVLLRNDGGFTFTDVSAVAGVADSGPATGCCWGDYDGDGWLDLYVCNRELGAPNRLYHNLGNGTFEEVAAQLGLTDPNLSFQGSFFDYDRDGDVDLYVSNDKGQVFGVTNHLWRNDGGTFVDVSAASGTDVSSDCMGVAVGDFDGDLRPDIYVTDDPPSDHLLLQQPDGSFVDSTAIAGVQANAGGWGALFFDYDNDGFMDLYVANVNLGNMMFVHGGTFPCVEDASALGIDHAGQSWCIATGDIDGDGDLDLFLQNVNDRIRLFINHEGELRHWLGVRLVGDGPNTFCVGATVDVMSASGTQSRQVIAGVGYKSSIPLQLHFGMGDDIVADQVVIRWPGGEMSSLNDVPVDQVLVVDQATTPVITDCNGNGTSDAEDIATGLSADANGDGIPDECQLMFLRGDCNQDGAIDLADAICALTYLFNSGTAACAVSLDSNADRALDIADPVSLLGYLFNNGPPPPPPFPSCDTDPAPVAGGGLGCLDPPACP